MNASFTDAADVTRTAISSSSAAADEQQRSAAAVMRAATRRLRNFWHRYRSSQIVEVENTLNALIGARSSLHGKSSEQQQRAVDDLFLVLTKKYGPEPAKPSHPHDEGVDDDSGHHKTATQVRNHCENGSVTSFSMASSKATKTTVTKAISAIDRTPSPQPSPLGVTSTTTATTRASLSSPGMGRSDSPPERRSNSLFTLSRRHDSNINTSSTMAQSEADAHRSKSVTTADEFVDVNFDVPRPCPALADQPLISPRRNQQHQQYLSKSVLSHGASSVNTLFRLNPTNAVSPHHTYVGVGGDADSIASMATGFEGDNRPIADRMRGFIDALSNYETVLSRLRCQLETTALRALDRELALQRREEQLEKQSSSLLRDADAAAAKHAEHASEIEFSARAVRRRDEEITHREETVAALQAELEKREAVCAQKEKAAEEQTKLAQRIAADLEVQSRVIFLEAEQLKVRQNALWKSAAVEHNKDVLESIAHAATTGDSQVATTTATDDALQAADRPVKSGHQELESGKMGDSLVMTAASGGVEVLLRRIVEVENTRQQKSHTQAYADGERVDEGIKQRLPRAFSDIVSLTTASSSPSALVKSPKAAAVKVTTAGRIPPILDSANGLRDQRNSSRSRSRDGMTSDEQKRLMLIDEFVNRRWQQQHQHTYDGKHDDVVTAEGMNVGDVEETKGRTRSGSSDVSTPDQQRPHQYQQHDRNRLMLALLSGPEQRFLTMDLDNDYRGRSTSTGKKNSDNTAISGRIAGSGEQSPGRTTIKPAAAKLAGARRRPKRES